MAVDQQAHWQSGEVVAVEPAADGVTRIVLRTERSHRVPPGSHVDLLVPVEGGQEVRSYSVVRSGADGREVTISVQLAPASRGGSRFMHTLRPGDRVELTQPLQNFPLGVGAPRYVLLAGGIGITALVAMAETLRARRADYELHYVGRSRAVMAYLDELEAGHAGHFHGYVDDEGRPLDLDAFLDGIGPADGTGQGTELYLCGPIRLMDAVRRGWQARGLPPTNLRFETFGNSGSWDAQPFLVDVPAAGRTVEVGESDSLLDALERAGIDVLSDCRKGECGLCQGAVLDLDGRIDHRDVFLSESQQQADIMMCACVSRVVAAAERPADGARGRVSIAIP